MATLFSIATGNFTSASTWELCDSTSAQTTFSSTSAIGTSNLDSSTFTPGAITVNGIALFCTTRATTPGGTFTITLRNSTDSVDVVSVTCNATDIMTTALDVSNPGGWVVFKFADTLLIAAKAYLVRLISSTGNVGQFYTNGSNNWVRQVLTTTTQAPASGDYLLVGGNITAAATTNSFVVTMDNTATTTFGTVATGAMDISSRGTLQYGIAASTNYYLRVKGFIYIYNGGAFNIGTSGTPMPSTSTAVLEMDATTTGDTGIKMRANGIFNAYGYARTPIRALLNANAIATATSLTSDVSTGWLSGEQIVIAPTTATQSQFEIRALTGNASGTSLPVASMTNAHSGTTPTQAELGVLDRNVKIRGLDSSHRGFFIGISNEGSGWTATWRYVECTNFQSGTCISNPVNVGAHDTTLDIQYSSFWGSGGSIGMINNSGSTTGTLLDTFSNNILYGTEWFLNIDQPWGTNPATTIVDNNLFMGSLAGGVNAPRWGLVGTSMTFTNNVMTGCSSGSTQAFNPQQSDSRGTIVVAGNTIHSCSGVVGIGASYGSTTQTYGTYIIWHNTVHGFALSGFCPNLVVDGATIFGCGSTQAGIYVNSAGLFNVVLKNFIVSGSTSFAQGYGMYFNPAGFFIIELADCTFGVTSGIKVEHINGDIYIPSNGFQTVQITGTNVKLASSQPVFGLPGSLGSVPTSFIRIEKNNQTAGNDFTYTNYGNINLDSVIYHTATPSERITPNTPDMVSYKMCSGAKRVAVNNGDTVTISVWVRRSSSSDVGATNYGGSQPRLIVRRNNALGFVSNLALATCTAANGVWQQISATTPTVSGDDGCLEFVVDCDGTAGWINVDDWTAS